MHMNKVGMDVSEPFAAKFTVERIILDKTNLDEVAGWQSEIQGPSVKKMIRDSVR